MVLLQAIIVYQVYVDWLFYRAFDSILGKLDRMASTTRLVCFNQNEMFTCSILWYEVNPANSAVSLSLQLTLNKVLFKVC